jgi:hypothetical protein
MCGDKKEECIGCNGRQEESPQVLEGQEHFLEEMTWV